MAPANEYGGATITSRTNLATYQLRQSMHKGDWWKQCHEMIVLQGISASPIAASVATIPMVDNNIIVSLHTYDRSGFLNECSPTTWGSASDTAAV